MLFFIIQKPIDLALVMQGTYYQSSMVGFSIAMKQRMATPGFRMEINEALVSVVKTAEKFFAEQQSSRGYKNW